MPNTREGVDRGARWIPLPPRLVLLLLVAEIALRLVLERDTPMRVFRGVLSFVGGHTPFPDSGSANNSWGPAEVWKFFEKF